MATKIGTLQNPEKTEALLPRTCIKAIADKNGNYLDEDLVKSDIDALKNGKVASMDAAITSLNDKVMRAITSGSVTASSSASGGAYLATLNIDTTQYTVVIPVVTSTTLANTVMQPIVSSSRIVFPCGTPSEVVSYTIYGY